MNATITGSLFSATATRQVSETFRVRTFVLRNEENVNGNIYENYVEFQLVNNNCDLLDKFQPNQPVTITYNPKGRLWTSPEGEQKCITNLNAWKIEPFVQQAPAPLPNWAGPEAQQAPTKSWGQPTTQPEPTQSWGQQPQPQSTSQAWGAQTATPEKPTPTKPPF